jgi:hypothetical protein
MALKSMSVAKLQDLKAKVDAAITEKVTTRRNELESELSKLDRHAGGGRRGRPPGRGGSQIPQPREPVRDLGRPWSEAEVARSGD